MASASSCSRFPVRAALFIAALLLAAPLASAAPARAIFVRAADAPTIKAAIASHKGHVVVVNFWATWCGPCVAEFPALVKLHRKYAAKGVTVIAVSADSPRDRVSKVEPFLRSKHASFTNFIQHASDPEVFIDAFDKSWSGDLPRTLIYDKQGRLVKALSDEQTFATFSAAVKPYL